jgi:hypothetical protein
VEKDWGIMSQMVVNRVFYLNVGSIHPMDIPSYVEAVKTALQMQTNDDGNQFVAVMQKEGRWNSTLVSPVRTGMKRSSHLLDLEKVQIATHVALVDREEWFKTLQERLGK